MPEIPLIREIPTGSNLFLAIPDACELRSYDRTKVKNGLVPYLSGGGMDYKYPDLFSGGTTLLHTDLASRIKKIIPSVREPYSLFEASAVTARPNIEKKRQLQSTYSYHCKQAFADVENISNPQQEEWCHLSWGSSCPGLKSKICNPPPSSNRACRSNYLIRIISPTFNIIHMFLGIQLTATSLSRPNARVWCASPVVGSYFGRPCCQRHGSGRVCLGTGDPSCLRGLSP